MYRISRQSMLYNISLLSFSGVLLQMMGFAYQVILGRMAGAQGLGLYQLVFPVYSVVMAGTLSGVRMAVTSLSASLSPERDMPQIRCLVRRSIATFVGLFCLIGLPALLLHDFIAERIVREPRASAAIAVILVCLFLTGFEGIFESLFLGIGRTQYTAISNLLEQGVKIFVVLFLLSRFGREGDHTRTAVLIALGMTVSEVPVLVWLLGVYRREVRRHRRAAAQPPEQRPKVLSVAVPVSMTSVVTTLLSSATVVLLPGRLSAAGLTHEQAVSALGVVSDMALPLLMLPMVLIRALSNVLLPTISMNLARRNASGVMRKIRKSFQATSLIVLPATAILIPLSAPLARILYRQELAPAYVLLLAIVAVINYYEVVSASILNGLGRQKRLMVCMIIGEGFQLALTFVLAAMPKLNIYGYIIGMVLGPLSVLLMNLMSIREFAGCLPRFTESFLIPLLAAGVAGGFTRYFYAAFPARCGELPHILYAALAGGLLCAGAFWAAGLRPVRYFHTLLEKKEKNL